MGEAMQRALALRPLAAARGFMTSAPARGGAYGLSPAKVDPKVEKWAAWREDIEETFFFTNKNNLRVGIFAIAIPVLIYMGTCAEMRQTDKTYGADKDPNSRGHTKDYMSLA